ncbi:MAG: PQQ-binding-like beta-propeller repeat protein [Hyphomicrobiales bacterium]
MTQFFIGTILRLTRLKLALLITAMLALSGCSGGGFDPGSLLSEKKEPIRGTRESVVSRTGALKPDPQLLTEPLIVPASQSNSNWVQAGGNSAHAMGNLALSSSIKRVWSVKAGEGSGSDGQLTAQPVTGGGRIYIFDTAGRVSAFSTQNGGAAWSVSLVPEEEDAEGVVGGGVAYHEGRVYATTPFGELVALSASNGSVVWRKKLEVPAQSAPTINGGRIFIIAVTNEVKALSLTDGAEVWSHQGVGEKASRASSTSAAASGGSVVVPFTTGEILAFNAATGLSQWGDALSGSNTLGASSVLSDVSARPVISGGFAYAIGHTGSMAAFRLEDGESEWSLGVSGTEMPWLAGEYLYTIVQRNTLSAISKRKGRARWNAKLSDTSAWVGPVMGGGILIAASSSGQLTLVSPENGQVTRKIDLGEPVYISPIIAGGTLYVLTDEATLMAFR